MTFLGKSGTIASRIINASYKCTLFNGGFKLDQDNQVLRQKLEKMAREGGARLFGVADLRPARDYLADIYGPDLIHLERGVVMAIPFPVGVINQLQDQSPLLRQPSKRS